MPNIGPAIIEYDRGDDPPIPHGEVAWIGATKARVTVSQWSDAERRLIPVDRIVDATVTETTDGAKIVGTHQDTKQKVTLLVTRSRKCKNC